MSEAPIRVAAGDVVMFPHGHAHVLSSAPGMRSKPDLKLYRRPDESHLPFTLALGAAAEAAPTHIVCGYLGCDARPYNPLLMALPNAIHVKDSAGGTLAAYVQLALAESKESRIGGECVLGRLSAVRPVLLAGEDLHWADGSTLDLAAFLIRSLPAAAEAVC